MTNCKFKKILIVVTFLPMVLFSLYISFFVFGLEYVNSKNSETFASGIYFKNPSFVFYRDVNEEFFIQLKIIQDADPDTFECVQSERTIHNKELTCGEYARDKHNGYYNGKRIIGSDGATYEHLKGVWSRDKDFIYVYENQQSIIDRASFEAITTHQGRDKNNEYQVTFDQGLVVNPL